MLNLKNLQFKKLFILLTCVIGLSACATPYDVDIVESNNKTFQNHDTQQANVVEKKTGAIEGIFTRIADRCADSESFECGALLGLSGSMASRDIASIETKVYKGPVQKSGIDVQIKALDTAQSVANPVVTGAVSITAIKKDKGSTKIDAKEGSEVSYEYREDHATSLGEGTAINTPGPAGGTVDTSTGHNTDDHSTTK